MTTALDAIKAAYPAQYYGDSSAGYLTRSTLIDVWNGVTQDKQSVNLLSLPAATDLLALTSDQWTLANVAEVTGHFIIPVSSGAITYPQRFYCDKNSPCAVSDMWGFSVPATEPPLSDLYSITASAYTDRQANPRQQTYDTVSGKLVDYVPPIVPQTLAEQASSEKAWILQQANLAAAMGQTFSAEMKAYVTAINAIAAGTDTTCTALPVRPDTIMN